MSTTLLNLISFDATFPIWWFGLVALAFIITFVGIPIIIKWAKKKNWMDNPNERSAHTNAIPTMGGIAIFIATLSVWLVGSIGNINLQILSIVFGSIVLFAIAIADDLLDLSAKMRFLIQMAMAFIVAYAGIRIESLHGLFGIEQLPILIQYGVSILLITGFVNAFNFIDGIDGLAGGLGFINSIVLGIVLLFVNQPVFALLSFSMAAALLAFLKYNFNPAKIFMGDTGSVVIGFLLSILAIKALNSITIATPMFNTLSLLVFAAILIPVFDIARTIFFRLLKGNSPLSADKTHIHHLLLKTGFNHRRAALILYASNSIIMLFAYFGSQFLSIEKSFIILPILCIISTEVLTIKKLFFFNKKSELSEAQIETLAEKNKYYKRIITN